MQENARVKSEFNTGTVRKVNAEKGTAAVHWDGFTDAIDVPIADLTLI